MSTIRRQSIISSGIVYFGFALGFVNTYLFTREGSGFTGAEYGLTGAFISFANIMSTFSLMGMNSYIYKFFPYYKDNLEPSENDMMTWALVSSLLGFLMVMTGAWIFKDLVIRTFGTNSPEFLQYYKWVFPFAFGLTLFALLEAFAWQLKKSVLTNYLREVQFRLFTTVLIILFYWGVIKDFDLFIKVYAFTYIALALILFSILFFKKDLNFTFSISRVNWWMKSCIARKPTMYRTGAARQRPHSGITSGSRRPANPTHPTALRPWKRPGNPFFRFRKAFIQRLMVDEKFQGKGFGRFGMEWMLEIFRADKRIKTVGISYEPDNDSARNLYASLGFVETGEIVDGEVVAELNLR